MSSIVIDGKQVVSSRWGGKAATVILEKRSASSPAGPSSSMIRHHAWVGAKSRISKEYGFKSNQHTLPEETTQEKLVALVYRMSDGQ